MMECWSNGIMKSRSRSNTPPLHHSNASILPRRTSPGLFALDRRLWNGDDWNLQRRVLGALNMSAELKPDLQLEIAHLLLIDLVGYSKLLVNEQIELLQELNQIVRSTECFRAAETSGKLIRVPTGDGMALLFFQQPGRTSAMCAGNQPGATRVIRRSGCGWEFTAARSIRSPMLTIKKTSLGRDSMLRSG